MKKTAIFLMFVMVLSMMTVFPIGTQAASKLDPYIGFASARFDESTNKNITTDGIKLPGGTSNTFTYKDIDFGEIAPDSVTLEMAGSYTAEQTAKLYLDNASGEPIAEFTAKLTSWSVATPVTANITTKFTGVHTLYLKTSSTTCDYYNILFTKPLAGSEAYVEYNLTNNQYEDIANSKYRREINMLCELGLSLKEKGELYYPHLPVTRGNFTQIIYKIMQGTEAQSKEAIFPDVTSKSEYFNSVVYASSVGYISGYEDGLFRPNKFISISEAVKIMSRVLGYDVYAEKQGGFESGYLIIAHNLGLLDGISETGVLTNEILACLVYNAICGRYYVPSGIGEYGVDYSAIKEGVLSETMGIYRVVGNIGANNITSLSSPGTKYKKNWVYIDGYDYDAGETDARALLGYDCEVFFKIDGGERTIVAIAPIKNVEITEIKSSDYNITKVGIDEITYLDATGKEETIKLDNPHVIYNGVALHDALSNVLEGGEFRGRIKYIENKSKNNVLFIDEYVNIEVSGTDISSKAIYDGLKQEMRKYEDGEGFSYFELNGKPVAIKDVKSGTVAAVYASKNETGTKMSRYLVSDKSVTGTVEGRRTKTVVTELGNSVSVADEIVVGGVTYKVAPEMIEYTESTDGLGNPIMVANDNVILGMTGEFKINTFGEIVTFTDETAASRRIGWLVKQGVKDPGSLSSVVQLQMYEDNGEIKDYNLASSCYVDGRLYKENTAVLTNAMCEKFVAYVVDSKGRIKELDTQETDLGGFKDCFTQLRYNVIYDWNTTVGTASLNSGVTPYILNGDIKVVLKPKDSTEPEDWKWTTNSSLNSTYAATLYSFNKEEGYIDFAEFYNVSATTTSFVFLGLQEGVDSKGDIRKKISVKTGTDDKSLFLDSDVAGDIDFAEALSVGDMFLGSVYNGEIKNLSLVRLKSGDKTLSYGSGSKMDALLYDAAFDAGGNITTAGDDEYGTMSDKEKERFVFGEVLSRDGNLVKIKRPNSVGSVEEYAYMGTIVGLKDIGTESKARIINGVSKNTVNKGDLVVFVYKYTTPKNFYIVGNIND